MRFFVTCFFVAITLISCEKVIPFDGEVSQPKLVVNSLFDAENAWNVHISRSISVLEDSALSVVENASVQIKDDQENIIETLEFDTDGRYTGNLYPQVGQNYKIEVAAPGFNSVSAQNNLPSPITILNVDTLTTLVSGEERLEMSVTFDDPASVSNYYLIGVHIGGWFEEENWNGTVDSVFRDYNIPILLEDPTFENYGNDRWENKGIFTDLTFDGQSKTIDIAINTYEIEEKVEELDFFEIRIFNVTRAAYLYNKSYDLYLNASGNPFAQPIQVYSNVNGGFGLFAGSQLNVFSIL